MSTPAGPRPTSAALGMRAVPPTPPAEPGTFPYERRRGPDGRMYQWRPHDQNATPPVFGVWALDQVLTDPPTLR